MTDENLEISLFQQAIDGKRDGYKNLEAFQRKKVLNKLIKKEFGIICDADEEDDI